MDESEFDRMMHNLREMEMRQDAEAFGVSVKAMKEGVNSLKEAIDKSILNKAIELGGYTAEETRLYMEQISEENKIYEMFAPRRYHQLNLSERIIFHERLFSYYAGFDKRHENNRALTELTQAIKYRQTLIYKDHCE